MRKTTTSLTEAQNGMWYAQKLDEANPLFKTAHYIEISGYLNVTIFYSAVQKTLEQAQALALRFSEKNLVPQQCYDKNNIAKLQLVDLRNRSNAKQLALAQIEQDLATPVSLHSDDLVQMKLFTLSLTKHIFYQRVHHILTDGYGMLLFEEQVAANYNSLLALENGQRRKVVTRLANYQQIIKADKDYLISEKRKLDKDFWQKKLSNSVEVIGIKDGLAHSAHSYLRYESLLSDDLVAQCDSYTRAHNLSWPDLVTALTAVFLCRHVKTNTNVFGIPYMGRLGQVAANIPAMVMNVLPWQVSYKESDDIKQFCIQASQQMRKMRRHGQYRSEQMRRDLELLGGQKRLYAALINVLPFDQAMQLDSLVTKRKVLSTGPVDDLTITFRAYGSKQLILTLDANPNLYKFAEIKQLQNRLSEFIQSCLTHNSFSQVATATKQEQHYWLYKVNDTAHPVPQITLPELLQRQIAKTPNVISICDEQQQLTYAQFGQRVENLAQYLIAQGVTKGSIVAVLMQRSIEMVVALHAIVKIGAAYLPLDVANPTARLAKIVQTAKPVLVLTDNNCLAQHFNLGSKITLLSLTNFAWQEKWQSIIYPLPKISDPAYVIFTSGSTGEPKGVVIEHQAIVNRLLWMQETYHIKAGQRILQKTPYTFDVSVWELFLPFICGASLVVAPPQAHKDPRELLNIIRQHQVTIVHFVPSMLAVFLTQPGLVTAGLALQHVFCSGEALPAVVRDKFHQLLTAQLHNLYGPTEAAVDVTYWQASKQDSSQPVPIGFPVWNTQIYILDDNLKPVPAGVPGTLYIAGIQLASGYLARPDLTAQRFIANPFASSANSKMYNSGDLAKWRADGAIEFLGRIDSQVKIRGLRIELDEIQHVLAKIDSVANAAVIACEDKAGQKYIAAYVVANDTQQLDFTLLKTKLLQQLPDYMVPTTWVQLDALPVTSNGKLDRKALPLPKLAQQRGNLPKTDLQKQLAKIFAKLLQITTPIYLEDDFFALGGHSLLAAQLVALLCEKWRISIGLGVIFEHSTLQSLAQLIQQLTTQEVQLDSLQQQGIASVLTLQKASSNLAPIFCIHPAGGISWCYAGLSRQLQQPARKVFALQSSALDLNYPSVTSLVELAKQYVAQIIKLNPTGPYHLVGWSIGGIIAQAMAVELQHRKLSVGMLALLDAYPSEVWQNKPEPNADAANKAILLIAGFDPQDLGNLQLTQENVIKILRQHKHPLGELTDKLLAGIIRVVGLNNSLVRNHQQQFYQGQAVYFRAALDHAGENLSPQQWQPYISNLIVHDIAALHGHLLSEPIVAKIAPILLKYLADNNY